MTVTELHCVTTHLVASSAIVCQDSVTMAQIAGVSLYTSQNTPCNSEISKYSLSGEKKRFAAAEPDYLRPTYVVHRDVNW